MLQLNHIEEAEVHILEILLRLTFRYDLMVKTPGAFARLWERANLEAPHMLELFMEAHWGTEKTVYSIIFLYYYYLLVISVDELGHESNSNRFEFFSD